MRAFTKGQASVLVASDVASRGLDIPSVQTVLSFDPATNLDAHVHRVGRAGRLSRDEQQSGTAYTLLTPQNSEFAFVLRNAFQREGREVSPELEKLANQCRRNRAGQNRSENVRTKQNKAGLGFQENCVEDRGTASYYGPGSLAPPAKRSRWS